MQRDSQRSGSRALKHGLRVSTAFRWEVGKVVVSGNSNSVTANVAKRKGLGGGDVRQGRQRALVEGENESLNVLGHRVIDDIEGKAWRRAVARWRDENRNKSSAGDGIAAAFEIAAYRLAADVEHESQTRVGKGRVGNKADGVRGVGGALFDARGAGSEADGRITMNARIGYVDGQLAEVGRDIGESGREPGSFAHLDDDGFILCVNVGVDIERCRRLAIIRVDCDCPGFDLEREGVVEGDFAVLVAASNVENKRNAIREWRTTRLRDCGNDTHGSGGFVRSNAGILEAYPLVVYRDGYCVGGVVAKSEAVRQRVLVNSKDDSLIAFGNVVFDDVDIEVDVAASARVDGQKPNRGEIVRIRGATRDVKQNAKSDRAGEGFADGDGNGVLGGFG